MPKSKLSLLALVTIGAVLTFLMAATVLADGNRDSAASSSVSLSSFGEARKSHRGRKIRVRCDHGQSLARNLRRARPYDRVIVRGTCHESVTIAVDHLILQGRDGATIDASQSNTEAAVLIDGARDFHLANLTVQNAPDQGILATHQAQGLLSNVSVLQSGTVGLSVDRSHLELTDVVLDDNRGGGMDAYTGSTVVVRGQLSANNTGGDGIAANGKTFLELRGAHITANNNAGTGVSVINDSRLQIFSFPEAQGSTITADSNGFAGIGIMGSALGVVGSQFEGSGANVITATKNGVFGFFMPAGTIFSPHATAKFVAQGNIVGMLLEDGGSTVIVGGLNLNSNAVGISAHGAGTLTMVSIEPNPSTISDNRTDLDLGFGTRATLANIVVETVSCDGTVLVRGATCPPIEP